MLNLKESFEFFKTLPLAKWKIADDNNLMSFDFPYYLKANVAGHKTDLDGVYKCNNIIEAKKYFEILKKKFGEVIIQENFDGIEMIVGVKSDIVFGKIIVVGFGGIFAEVKKDVSFRALPISREDAIKMTEELKGFEIFNSRGKKYDLEKFYTFIEKVAYIGEKFDIKELDLNPVMIGEKEVKIVDARVELD